MSSNPKLYKIMLVTSSEREYMVEMTATGDFHSEPPFVLWELEDGMLRTEAHPSDNMPRNYSSLNHFASEHGLIAGEWVSIDPVN